MRNFSAKLGVVCALLGCLVMPAAALGSKYPIPKYPIPKPSGGSKDTKRATTAIALKLEHETGKRLAKGFTIRVSFPKAGRVVCTVNGGGKTIGSGKARSDRAGSKNLKITFTASGKRFLETHAGRKVTVICTFTPKHGASKTSTARVTLG